MSKQIREGYKMTELGEIPVEWEVQELSEILEICYGKSQKEVECNDGIYKILGTGGVIGYTNEFLWDKPSVLIGRKGTIDKPQYIEEPFWTVDTLFYTKIKNQNIAKWIYYYLNNIDLKRYNEATGVPSLSVSNLNKIRVSRPTVAEQKKIVEIISTVDNQIENTDGLIEKTKELKKGLMQRLLTKGIGHTEFKMTEIGKIPKVWKIEKLNNVTDVRDGTHDSPKQLEEGIPFVTSKNLKEFGIDFQDITYISKEDHENISKRSKVDNGDILFAMIGTIGNPVIVNTDFEFSIKNVALIKFENSNMNNIFIKNLLESEVIKKQFDKKSNGGVQKFISLGMIRNLEIPCPSLEEQQKIAFILSEVDQQIEQYNIRKEKLITLKKGLMQQILTGKKRVIV